jgi:hypothetical protein
MQIEITSAETGANGRQAVGFTSRYGDGRGIWCGDVVAPKQQYQIELTLLDELDLTRNASVVEDSGFVLQLDRDHVVLTVQIESIDPDNIAYLRLGSDCLFLADIPASTRESGVWLRLKIPCARLELWPF